MRTATKPGFKGLELVEVVVTVVTVGKYIIVSLPNSDSLDPKNV